MGEPKLQVDARAQELAPELLDRLGDAAALVEREGALLGDAPGSHVAVIAGRSVVTAPRADLPDAILLPPMPGDRQRSPTTFLLGLEGRTALVPELEQDAFDAIGLVHERSLGRLVQTFLDVQVADLEARDLEVRRLPMMPPVDLERVPERPESWVGTFISPTDSLLVDIDDASLAFCPSFDEERFPATYRELAKAQRSRWRELFEVEGREVIFVDVGALTRRGSGLLSLVAD